MLHRTPYPLKNPLSPRILTRRLGGGAGSRVSVLTTPPPPRADPFGPHLAQCANTPGGGGLRPAAATGYMTRPDIGMVLIECGRSANVLQLQHLIHSIHCVVFRVGGRELHPPTGIGARPAVLAPPPRRLESPQPREPSCRADYEGTSSARYRHHSPAPTRSPCQRRTLSQRLRWRLRYLHWVPVRQRVMREPVGDWIAQFVSTNEAEQGHILDLRDDGRRSSLAPRTPDNAAAHSIPPHSAPRCHS